MGGEVNIKNTGIVILNYNSCDIVMKLLNKIHGYKALDHILVVDNCSTDNSYATLSNLKFNRYEVIQTLKNGGYAYGNNYGVKHLMDKYNTDIIFIANPDVTFEEDFVLEILKTFDTKPEYAILSGVVLDNTSKITKSWWSHPVFMDSFLECAMLYRKIKKMTNRVNINYEKEIMDIDIIMGSLFAIQVSALSRVNYFDENTFLYFEEDIISMKLKKYNYKLGILTNQRYIHDHSKTINKALKAVQISKNYWKSKIYYEKCYRDRNEIQIFFLKLAMKYACLETWIMSFILSRFK